MIYLVVLWGLGAVFYSFALYPSIKEQEVLAKHATPWTVALSLFWPLLLPLGLVAYVVMRKRSNKED